MNGIDTFDYPPEPNRDAPPNTEWITPWYKSWCWTSAFPEDPPDVQADADIGYPIWARDYLLHDGHEECCHHYRNVWVRADGRE